MEQKAKNSKGNINVPPWITSFDNWMRLSGEEQLLTLAAYPSGTSQDSSKSLFDSWLSSSTQHNVSSVLAAATATASGDPPSSRQPHQEKSDEQDKDEEFEVDDDLDKVADRRLEGDLWDREAFQMQNGAGARNEKDTAYTATFTLNMSLGQFEAAAGLSEFALTLLHSQLDYSLHPRPGPGSAVVCRRIGQLAVQHG
ncbi:hypothetical protein EON64_05085 [archaeon]|nr:MAG: hypothetical protein EON64_05085 [archaeon]